ncbi:Os08g0217350 [Oryza sativa Japonica Group]|uniref:Os08g0217350 protein n=1 Tax=Oryza sativa subsp. japonica TaxID=39947 RepID=A0A0P0XD09_ORYSJ|nr:Os08g0217350 [Oryza sativa Japonica Group]
MAVAGRDTAARRQWRQCDGGARHGGSVQQWCDKAAHSTAAKRRGGVARQGETASTARRQPARQCSGTAVAVAAQRAAVQWRSSKHSTWQRQQRHRHGSVAAVR